MPTGCFAVMNRIAQDLPKSALACLHQELRPGEELHWVGTYGCLPGGAVRDACVFLGVVWCIAVAQVGIALQGEWCIWPFFTLLIPVLVTYIGYTKWREYKQTICLLTNQRVAWLVVGKGCVRSLALTQNMIRCVVMRGSGCGDIVFAVDDTENRAVFYNVPQVRAVVQQMNDLSAGR